MTVYDTIIIGGGPGGYRAAERLGQAKKKVLLIEGQQLGGTCLNVGCVPAKTLLNSAKQYIHAKEAGKFGVQTGEASFDWAKIQQWKTSVIEKLRGGIASQMKRFGVELAQGLGEITAPPSGAKHGTVTVRLSDGKTEEYTAPAILASPGSAPVTPPIPGAAGNPKLLDSTGLLSIGEVPKRLAVIGGGVIGVEFAGLFSALGTEVTVIEMMEEIIPFMDKELAPLYRKALNSTTTHPPVVFRLGCKVERIEGGTVHYTTKEGGRESVEADAVLMAIGRRPVLNSWGAEAAGIGFTPKGVTVDDFMRTNVPGIWAAGDITGQSLLAHSAYRMAEVAVRDILGHLDGKRGRGDRWRSNAVPWAVYGLPEAAGIGITEQEAASRGIAVRKHTLPMTYSGRFVAENSFAGIGAVKVIAGAENSRILGIHAVGAYASEFIWGGAAIIEQELGIEDVKQLIFPHPTVGELIRDAVWEL
jgi:dihydrolipoamide dehydrogenase